MWLKYTAIIAALLLSAYSGHKVTELSWSERWATAVQANAEQALADQRVILDKLAQVEANYAKETANRVAAERNSRDLSIQLQQQIAARSKVLQTSSTRTVSERANAATTALVFAELFGRAEQRAADLAGYAEELRAALTSCQGQYNAQKQSIQAVN